ncbi:conserved hypothetical protein [Ferrimonas balearica DSM 9799]|uniref:Uncharacterized protein n=1 Tax=Ferrimonas balearica (strain DSM 9799 / CCM 4581 / KCTC 23876 / PAT) TaxID=550540 RepID=E1SPY0_FERBD|nr:hypothetical protein [Ferrimonas balearica]ADN75775.1 conserved hypothetical protein [Ferrimonas balearica DSM 9799]
MRWLWLLLTALPLLCSARPYDDGFALKAGGFWASVDSSFGANIIGVGDPIRIDFESDLALEESKFSPFLELTYRFNDRHLLGLNYITLHRDARSVESEKSYEFTWEGETYQVNAGAFVSSQLDIDIYQLMYGYTLYSSEQFGVIGTLGAHVMDIDARIGGQLEVVSDEGTNTITETDAIGKVTAPLPNFGIVLAWQAMERLLVAFNAQYLSVSFDSYDGRLLDMRLQASYYVTPQLALGLAWQDYDIQVDEERQFSNVDINFNYHGPAFMVIYEF